VRTLPERLSDIQTAITRIIKHTRDGRDRYNYDEFLQTWVIYNLYIVGEATRAIVSEFPTFKDQHPEIKWTEIISLRTVLAHKYFDVDLDVVWSVADQSIPELEQCIDAIVEEDKEI